MHCEASSTLEYNKVENSGSKARISVYFQPTSMRSAQFTSVMEKVNGVQWSSSREEKSKEKLMGL